MEYRKKNLKPRKNIEKVLFNSLCEDDPFMHKLEFYCMLRKTIYLNQNEHGIKAAKPYLITTEGLKVYLNDAIRNFIKIAQKQASKEQLIQLRRLFQLKDTLDLDPKGHLQDRVIESLVQMMRKDPKGLDTEEIQKKAEETCNMINQNELKAIYKSKCEKMLATVQKDRERAQHRKAQYSQTQPAISQIKTAQNVAMSRQKEAKSYIIGPSQVNNINQQMIKPNQPKHLLSLQPMNTHANEGQEIEVTSQDPSVFSIMHSGKHTPIRGRKREDTLGTKDSSNNDETEIKHDFKSPIRTGDQTFASHTLIQAKLDTMMQKGVNNDRVQPQKSHELHVDIEKIIKLEKIISHASGEENHQQSEKDKGLSNNDNFGTTNYEFKEKTQEMIFEEDQYSEVSTSKKPNEPYSVTQMTQSQYSEITPDKTFEEQKESNFNLSQSDFNDFQTISGANSSQLTSQHFAHMKEKMSALQKALTQVNMKKDIKDDLSKENFKQRTQLVQPGFLKQTSHTYPISRNQVQPIS